MDRRLLVVLLPLLTVSITSAGHCIEPDSAQYHILHTEEATTVGQGNLQTEIELGVTKQPDASELYSIPRIRATYGLSEWADIEFEYEVLAVRDTDFTKYPSGEFVSGHSDEGSGDLRIKLKMTPFAFGRHLLGAQGITKLSNSDRDDGLGTDESDFMWNVLLSSNWGRLVTHVNGGMAILGDHSQNRNQRDYFIWGIGGEYEMTDSLTLMAEIYGSTRGENGEDGFTDNIAEGTHGTARAEAAVGLTGPMGDWRWGVLGFKGLNSHSNDWGLQVGLSRYWGIRGLDVPAIAPSTRAASAETYYNPMVTTTAYTIPERNIHLELAAKCINQPDDSDLYAIPDVVLGWGIAPWADFRLKFQYLKAENTNLFDQDGNVISEGMDSNGFGDIWIEIKASPVQTRLGRLGAQLVTKLPSANDEKALGTDETDVLIQGILSTDWSEFFPDSLLARLRTHLNAGVAIQGDPHKVSSRDDIFVYGILAEYEIVQSLTLWTELEGSEGNSTVPNISEGVYGDDYLHVRLGLTGPFSQTGLLSNWKWGITASAGLSDESRDWTASVGVSRTWGL